MSVSSVNVDKEAGILPVNWLSERKLRKYKTLCYFAQCVGRNISSITKVGTTYKCCKVTGKLDGIFPPMWLLFRTLPQKHETNGKGNAGATLTNKDHWNSWTKEMQYTCRHTLTNGLVHAMQMPGDTQKDARKASEQERSTEREREREKEKAIYIALIETKLPKLSPSSPPKFAPFRILSWITKS